MAKKLRKLILMGLPSLLLTIATYEVSRMTLQYISVDDAVQSTAQYISLHGYKCYQLPTSCTMTVGNIATYIEAASPAVDASRLNVTLHTASCRSNSCTNASTVSCSPLNTCENNSSIFPPAADNALGNEIQVEAFYKTFTPRASSTLRIQF